MAKYRKFCQQSLWDEWEKPDEEIRKVAEKFVMANCYDRKVACQKFSGKRGDDGGEAGDLSQFLFIFF
ncbi:MAG: hypothetical protein ACOYN8_12130 [Pseudanabaena sp.]